MYPYVNFFCLYPIGHPDIYFLNDTVNWTTFEEFSKGLKEVGMKRHGIELDDKGLYKVLVEPGGDTLIPPLPYRHLNTYAKFSISITFIFF